MFFHMFLLLGTIYLIILTVQDYREMMVDSKYNYILVGVSISLLTHVNRSIWFILAIVIGLIFFNWMGASLKYFGKGDFSAFNWIFIGLSIINPIFTAFYVFWITLLGVIYHQTRRFIGKKKGWGIKPVPFYPVILGAWLLTIILLI